jgi:hypothetical protein
MHGWMETWMDGWMGLNTKNKKRLNASNHHNVVTFHMGNRSIRVLIAAAIEVVLLVAGKITSVDTEYTACET